MSESPTFVAKFADGEVTRMTTFTPLKKLDVMRGVRLARHAYRSRKRQEPPAMVTARFEKDGQMLACYSGVELEAVELEDAAPNAAA